MRKRYVQQPDGSLKFAGISYKADHASNTWQVGDYPDIKKDVERRKADHARQQKQERLNTLKLAVEQHRR